MFETGPILWLQAVGSPALTWALSVVSLLGYTFVYVVVLLALGVGARLRPSLAVIVAAILAAVLVAGVKLECALPRPDEVDSRVRRGAQGPPVAFVERGGAPDFWSLPRPEAVAAARLRIAYNFGFPSGHVAGTTSVLLAAAFFFRSRRTLVFAGLWVPLMALSRMYLGRHFLADVLGGVAVGLLAVALAIPLVRALEWAAFVARGRRGLVLLGLLAAASLGLARVTWLPSAYLGCLAGVSLVYAFLSRTGPPPEGGNDRQRIARVASALAILALVLAVAALAGQLRDAPGWRPAALAGGVVVTTAPLLGTIALARRFRLHA
jgi:membrane-associated phospholipid phosphatase